MKILTFDIEDWFHILNHSTTKTEDDWIRYPSRIHGNVDRILDLLDMTGRKGTFFCLGWVGKNFPEIVRKIADRGHEIGSHSNLHQLVFDQSPDEFSADLRLSIDILSDITGTPIRSYRAPGFSVKKADIWVFEELIAAGIEIDCSIFPAARAHGGFPEFGDGLPAIIHTPSGSIKEFPMNTARVMGKPFVFSGGGYFRLIPYNVLSTLVRRSPYVMTYFHPRDFDPGQPMIDDLSAFRKWKSYYGLKGAEKKLEKLITEFEFLPLGRADAQMEWNGAAQIDLSIANLVHA